MFKIAKLEQINDEKINIDYVTHEQYNYENGETVLKQSFKTLSFDISGDNYSFSFDLNCNLEKLLEIPLNETINFNKYILQNETYLNIKNLNGIVPQSNIKITRYLKNKFVINIIFYTEYSNDDNDYSGMIEFSFNLDDFINKSNE